MFLVACVTRRRHRAAALPSQLPFLIQRGCCVLHAPRFIDGGRALRARSAENCETAIRKRIARTVVTTVTRALERAARQRSLFAYDVRRAEAKIEI